MEREGTTRLLAARGDRTTIGTQTFRINRGTRSRTCTAEEVVGEEEGDTCPPYRREDGQGISTLRPLKRTAHRCSTVTEEGTLESSRSTSRMEESLTGSTLTIDPRASNIRKKTALPSIGPLLFFLDFSRTRLFHSLALPHRIQRSSIQVLRISLSLVAFQSLQVSFPSTQGHSILLVVISSSFLSETLPTACPLVVSLTVLLCLPAFNHP